MSTTETTEARTLRHASRLIKAVTGEEYGDGMTVMDIGVGIAEGSQDTVWVTGDWNDTRVYDEQSNSWKVTDNTPSRLLSALERIGVDCWYHDQCSVCPECYRLIDTEQMFGTAPAIWVEDSGLTCLECVAKDLNDFIEDYIDNSDRALPSQLEDEVLTAAGWTSHDEDFRNGWYGREDSPAKIMEGIHAESPEGTEVIFQITSSNMFELSFNVWTRTVAATGEA